MGRGCGRAMLLALLPLAAAACQSDGLLYAFTQCDEDTGTRSMFAYQDPDCETTTIPAPVLGVPCDKECSAGMYLTGRTLDNRISALCKHCPAGTFSLGGGFSIQGSLGDWNTPWPIRVTADCLYRGDDYQWHFGEAYPPREDVPVLENMTLAGCRTWAPLAAPGQSAYSVYSGENRARSEMFSFLRLSFYLVRPGRIDFRYRVDAELGYDFLRVIVDLMQLIQTSHTDWTTATFDLDPGQHRVQFEYFKDYSDDDGRDAAEISDIQVIGTSWTDYACSPCSGTGISPCTSCEANTYSEGNECRPCPAGFWAPQGSSGIEDCKPRDPCAVRDIELTFSRCTPGSVSGDTQREYSRWAVEAWRQPHICDEAAGGVALRSSVEVWCEMCQPGELRNSLAQCEPCPVGQVLRESVLGDKCETCPAALVPASEKRYAKWHHLPEGFTVDESLAVVWHANGTHIGVWRRYAVGTAAALLRFPVAMAAKGMLWIRFHSPGANPLRLRMHVDDVIVNAQLLRGWPSTHQVAEMGADAARLERADEAALGPVYTLKVALDLGDHEVVLEWLNAQNAQMEDIGTVQVDEVVVEQVKNPAPTRCVPCRPGSAIAGSGAGCSKCPAGTIPLNGVCTKCSGVRAFAADPGMTECRTCGPGTLANKDATGCVAEPLLSVKREITYPSRKQITETYNTTALAQMVKEAGAKGFRTLTLAGKEYNFGIFSPIFPPAGGASEAADDLAHIWSVTYDQSSPSGVCGAATVVWDRGDLLQEVRGVRPASRLPSAAFDDEFGGVELVFARTEAPEAAREDCTAATVSFVCDPTCCRADRWQRAVTLVDGPVGATEGNFVSPCDEVVRLEWRTPAACPLCTPDHFEKITGPCDVYGRQPVHFIVATPCVGALPGMSIQECDIETPVSIRTMIIAVALVLLAMACGLACLYRKWQETHQAYSKLMVQYGSKDDDGVPSEMIGRA